MGSPLQDKYSFTLLNFIKMKTSGIIPLSDQINGKENRIKTISGNLLKAALFVFLISWVSILSSCRVEATATPRYNRQGVIIERHTYRDRHDRGDRHNRDKRHNHGEKNEHNR